MSEEGATDGEEDWFERALAEEEAEGGADEPPDDPEPEDSETKDSVTEDEEASGDGERGEEGDEADGGDWLEESGGTAGAFEDSEPEHTADPVTDRERRDSGGAQGTGGDEGGGGSWLDQQSSGAAFAEGDDDMFEDDFAAELGSTGEGDEFADEDFSSDIPRIDLGIEGLDEMIQGGVPKRHLLVCIGGAGSGKTTFGLQFLHHGLQQGQKGVFITLEQSHETIMDTAAERGWDFDGYEAEDELAVVDLDPVEMANSLDNIQGELPGLIEQFGADRLVLDSVSLLEMMYDDQARRRTEVFDFTRSLKQAGVTTFLTSEASQETPYASRHGIIEYLTDGVFVLQYVRSETAETRLAVEIQKIRNANHSRETKPYEITMDGISVYQQANIF